MKVEDKPWPALFVSDIHLSTTLPKTVAHFLDFLKIQAPQTERLYLLGDVFEYWAGDDDIDHEDHRDVIGALKALHECGTQVFWIAGNRDFLVGQEFAEVVGASLLADPFALSLAGRELILSHGDALCTDDIEYMKFRAMVRQPKWQTQFLSQPLAQRKAIIAAMRQQSSEQQKHKQMAIMDVNPDAVKALLAQFPHADLIHGHTHRHAIHQHESVKRWVLPDWDFDGTAAHRGGYLKLTTQGHLEFCYIADAVGLTI
ncbi:MAG: UDP-2,3-diacylglucosamine diphosphatase [Burkholderiaceae bacterium]|nr:MAG: UDP-2,3-diacylglucosamine diphosphatase [Burkholderiaceae bacterium]